MNTVSFISSALGIPMYLLFIGLLWSLVWKGLALWKSARKGHSVWFILLLVINTLGIFEILYIYVFSEMKKQRVVKKAKKRKKR